MVDVDSSNAIGRDLIEKGGDLTIESKDQVRRARQSGTKSSGRAGKSFALVDSSVTAYASGGGGNVALDPNESLETFLPSSGSLYDEGVYLMGLRFGSEAALEESVVGCASGEGPSSEFRPPYLGS